MCSMMQNQETLLMFRVLPKRDKMLRSGACHTMIISSTVQVLLVDHKVVACISWVADEC